jgi:hypothetical protein
LRPLNRNLSGKTLNPDGKDSRVALKSHFLTWRNRLKKDFWTVVADENDKLRKAARTDRKSYFWEDVRWNYEKPVYDAKN